MLLLTFPRLVHLITLEGSVIISLLAFLEDLNDFPHITGSGMSPFKPSLSKFNMCAVQGKKGANEREEMKTKMNPEED